MQRLDTGTADSDLVIGLTRDEYIQAIIDAAVKKQLIPLARRLDPAMCEYVGGDKVTPYHLVVMAPGMQLGNGVTACRKEPE